MRVWELKELLNRLDDQTLVTINDKVNDPVCADVVVIDHKRCLNLTVLNLREADRKRAKDEKQIDEFKRLHAVAMAAIDDRDMILPGEEE